MTKPESQVSGVAMATGAGLAFGTLAIFAKLAYDKGASALPVLAGRFVVATALLALFQAATRRTSRVSRATAVKLLLLGGLGYAFEALLFFAALERAPAAVVGLIFYSFPLWTTLVGFMLGFERPSAATIIALALGSAGVVAVFSLPEASSSGLWLALAASLAVAAYLTSLQIVMRGVDPYAGAIWTSVGATVALVTAMVVTTSPVPFQATGELVGLGLVSAVAYVLLYRSLVLIGSARAAIAMMVEPVTTVVLAAIVLDEEITLRVAVGAVLVIAALPILARRRRNVPLVDPLVAD